MGALAKVELSAIYFSSLDPNDILSTQTKVNK
jgi:hypothetical protein